MYEPHNACTVMETHVLKHSSYCKVKINAKAPLLQSQNLQETSTNRIEQQRNDLLRL